MKEPASPISRRWPCSLFFILPVITTILLPFVGGHPLGFKSADLFRAHERHAPFRRLVKGRLSPTCRHLLGAVMRRLRLPLIGSLLLASASHKSALLPNAVDDLQAAVKRSGPTWQLKGMQIQIDHVVLTACLDESSCFTLGLSEAGSECEGKPAGPWCVSWKTVPPEADKASVLL